MKNVKGIILAGGYGTRLYPLTSQISKQMLPVFDKPMIYYPISTLFLADIKDILIISSKNYLPAFKSLLGDGSKFGVNFTYAIQEKPDGLASAYKIAKEFLNGYSSFLILGDNIFYGDSFKEKLNFALKYNDGCTIFTHKVINPSRYGIVELDNNQKIISIEEKPIKPKSKNALTGLYYFDSLAIDYVKDLIKSERGEYEITDLINCYLKIGKVKHQQLGRGFNWFDAGTFESLLESSQFIQSIEHRQGFKIACLEEISLKKEWISNIQFKNLIESYPDNKYKDYLNQII